MASILNGRNLNILLVVFGVVIIALASASGYLFMQNQSLSSGLENAVGRVGLKKGVTVIGDVDALVGEINSTRSKVSALQSQYDNLVNSTSTYRKQIRDLQFNNTSLKNTVSSLDSQIRSLEANRTALQGQLESLKSDNASMQATIDSLNQQIFTLHIDMDSLKSAADEFSKQVETLKSNEVTMNSTIDSLNQQIFTDHIDMAALNSQINTLNQQINSLQSQIDTLSTAKLIGVNLNTIPNARTQYLEVTGEVCNVGTITATNCYLHVMGFQNNILIIDSYISLGDIAGEGWVSVNQQFSYSGFTLTAYNSFLSWS